MPDSHILQFIGGLAFFFYGLYTIHQVLQAFGGDRLKNMIAKATEGSIKSFTTGIVVTVFFQSSTAITVMLVGLASSGLITLTQGMAVALGSGIGTTFVVLLVSVKSLVQYGIVAIVAGLLVRFLGRRKIIQLTGEILFGFGLVFFGMTVMSQATVPLSSSNWLPEVFYFLHNHPLANFLLAVVITALVHSSGVVLGVLVALAFSSSITFDAAFPLILGANLGTALTAVLASYKARVAGKRVAFANLLHRLAGVVVLLIFLAPATHFFENFCSLVIKIFYPTPHLYTQIALTHFFYNVFVAMVFLPLLPLGKKLFVWLIPDREESEEFGPKYLDEAAMDTPSLAFVEVTRELVRMGEIVQKMFVRVLDVFEKYDLDRVDEIEAQDHFVDTLYKAIKFYLAKLAFKKLESRDGQTSLALMTATNELESIGDTIEDHFLRLARKKWNKGAQFSPEGWQEICLMHKVTNEMMELAMAALSSSNIQLARKMLKHYEYYCDQEDKLKMSHLKRLYEERRESIESSAIHLEMISLYHRIHLSLLTMIRFLLPDQKIMFERVKEED